MCVRVHRNKKAAAVYGILDLDNNIYNVIQIGSQYWLDRNWACTKFKDGSPIPLVTNNTEWSNLTDEAYCNYNNTESNVYV